MCSKLDEEIKALILFRDGVILFRYKADQEYNAAKSEKEKQEIKFRMDFANCELSTVNKKLGL